MSEKKIKTIIFILSIALVVILFLLIYSYRKNIKNYNDNFNNIENVDNENTNSENVSFTDNDEELYEYDPWDEDIPIEEENLELIKQTDLYSYFLMKQCVEKFYQSVQSCYNLLDEDAKNTLNINNDTIYNIYGNINNPIICIDEVYLESVKPTQNLYKVYYRIGGENVNTQNLALMVRVDLDAYNFSVYPYSYLSVNNYLKDNNPIILKNINSIEDNEYNRYDIGEIYTDNQAVILELFERLKIDLQIDVNHLYNSLDEDYKAQRFANTASFNEYVNTNRDSILNDSISKFKVKQYSSIIQYYGITQTENHYIFNFNNIMDYTILLDNYTSELPQYKEIYNNSRPKVKGEYCLDRVINAINDKNYNFIYDKLSVTQKAEYSDINAFATYLKNAFYEENSYKIEDYMTLSENNAYQYLIKITDKTGKQKSFRRYDIRIVLQDEENFILTIEQNIN